MGRWTGSYFSSWTVNVYIDNQQACKIKYNLFIGYYTCTWFTHCCCQWKSYNTRWYMRTDIIHRVDILQPSCCLFQTNLHKDDFSCRISTTIHVCFLTVLTSSTLHKIHIILKLFTEFTFYKIPVTSWWVWTSHDIHEHYIIFLKKKDKYNSFTVTALR